MTMTNLSLFEKYPDAAHFKFGDNQELCAALTNLVRCRRKTATCMPLQDVFEGVETMPRVGRQDIALNWDDTPALVIETQSIKVCQFHEVDEDFALAEGENDSLQGWQRDHEAYFSRNRGFAPDMLIICERFKVVDDPGSS